MLIDQITARGIREPGGPEYVVVGITTDTGIVGYGEASSSRDLESAVVATRRALANLPGQNPERAVRVDEDLRRSGAPAAARAAANSAVLDILARSAKAPLYETLGGPTRNKVRAMAVVNGGSAGELNQAVAAAKAQGYLAFSIPLKLPAGMERGRSFFTNVRKTMDELRAANGDNCDFVLDCGGLPSPGEALSIADRMADFHLLWLDEPCGEVSVSARASISRGSVTPVGFGRTLTANSDFQDLLRADAIDVLRPGIALHGVTPIRKAAAIAETYYVAVAPYHRGGPIGTAMGIHIAASLPNSFIQEVPFSTSSDNTNARRKIAGGWGENPVDGFFELPGGNGLGINVDEDALVEYTVAG